MSFPLKRCFFLSPLIIKGVKIGKTFKLSVSVGFQEFGGMKPGHCGLFINLYKHFMAGGYGSFKQAWNRAYLINVR